MFKLDQLEIIEDDIEKYIINERERYSNLYKIIDAYIIKYSKSEDVPSKSNIRGDTRIYLSGNIGINILLRRKRSSDDYSYEFYTENPLLHANNLSNLLADEISKSHPENNWFIIMNTVIPYQDYTIMVDNRAMVSVHGLKVGTQEGKFTAFDLIKPIETSLFDSNNKILVMSPETYLVNIYKILSSPNMVSSWEETLRNEYKLFYLLQQRMEDISVESKPSSNQRSFGGFGSFSSPRELKDSLEAFNSLDSLDVMPKKFHHKNPKHKNPKHKNPKHKKHNDTDVVRKNIEQALLSKFVNKNKDVVLLGEHALKIINFHKPIFGNKEFKLTSHVISITSANDINKDFEKIKSIVQSVVNSINGTTPVVKFDRDVPVLNDFRMVRTTIKYGIEGSQKEIMYIYNSAQYELIPCSIVKYKNDSVQIGNPFVIMRFLLVDIWVLRWIYVMGLVHEHFFQNRLDNLINSVLSIRMLMTDPNVSTTITKDTISSGKKNLSNIKDELFGSNDSKNSINPLTVFQEYNVGQYMDEVIARKLSAQDGKRFHPYLPQQYFLTESAYRII